MRGKGYHALLFGVSFNAGSSYEAAVLRRRAVIAVSLVLKRKDHHTTGLRCLPVWVTGNGVA